MTEILPRDHPRVRAVAEALGRARYGQMPEGGVAHHLCQQAVEFLAMLDAAWQHIPVAAAGDHDDPAFDIPPFPMVRR